MKPETLVMLVVEDNPGDVLLLAEAIEFAAIDARMHVVENGEEAMDFLGRRGSHAEAPRPGLIVLDLNLPLKGGWEVLAELRADPGLRDIPVAILTSSRTDAGICDGDTSGRCRYFVKTGDFKKLVGIVRQLERFAR